MDTNFIKIRLLLLFLWISICAEASSVSSTCPLIFEHARQGCGESSEIDCESKGCCWDSQAETADTRCYKQECAAGYFGWGCRFECQCGNDESCDRYSGQCPSGCPATRWGIGCMLDNECTYNDDFGVQYMGKKANTTNDKTCLAWSSQKAYPDNQFPEKSRVQASHYCRNPQPPDYRTWCYIQWKPKRKWDYCNLRKCECMPGRFGTNCEHECHCNDKNEACDAKTGECMSGCDFRWEGPACQRCVSGWFGAHCERRCRCHLTNETCHVETGHCESGCLAGWQGESCQTECSDGWFGFNCEFKCNCMEKDETCNKEDGECYSGCQESYSGPGCQIQCRCRDQDEVCAAEDGSCQSGCRAGWGGLACHIEMPRLRNPPTLRNRTATGLTVNWRRWSRLVDFGDGDVSGYILTYDAYDGSGVHREHPTGDSHTLTKLQKDTLYGIQIIPIHERGFEGLPSPALNVSTCANPLSGPTNVELMESYSRGRSTQLDEEEEMASSSQEHGGVGPPETIGLTVTWKLPDPSQWGCDIIGSFRVYTMGPLHSGFAFYKMVSQPQKAVEISDVDAYANYSVGVTMENSAGLESDMTLTQYIGKSGPVSNLLIESDSNSLTVTWDPPIQSNSPVLYYIIRYKEMRIGNCDVTQVSWNPRDEVEAEEARYTVTNVHPYTKYKVRVWAMTTAGDGKQTSVTDTTKPTAPKGEVKNLRAATIESTLASFAWEAPDCKFRNGEYGGFKYVVRRGGDESMRTIIATTTVNSTEVTLNELVPWTNYRIEVAFVNHVGEGPMSEALTFTTLEGRPPAPRNLIVRSKQSNSVTLSWEAPDPPHGVIKSYELKYWSKDIIQAPRVIHIAPLDTRYEMMDLEPNTTFLIQVRAKTNAGAGEWSPVINAFTEETYPSEPQFLKNVTRTASSIVISWNPPAKIGGILQKYKIMCKPHSPLTQYLQNDVEYVIDPNVLTYEVTGLVPGSQYRCEVMASTKKGYGPSVIRSFWTEPQITFPPPSPKLDASKNTDSTITLTLVPDDATLSASTESATSVYQIVVQMVDEDAEQSTLPRRRRRRRAALIPPPSAPCGLAYEDLLPYKEALAAGHQCYVVAEIQPPQRELVFVVGDNKTYGQFHNPPLETGQTYNVFVGLIVTVDGVTTSSYSRTESPVVAQIYQVHTPEPGTNSAMLAGAAVGAILILLIILIIIFVIIRKKKFSRQQDHQCDNGMVEKTNNTEFIAATTTVKIIDGKPNNHCTGNSDHGMNDYDSSSDDDANETDQLFKEVDVPIPSKPVSVEDLWNFIKEKKAENGLHQEYETLPHNLRYSCKIARRQENKNKNRYGNIVAYDHSRVVLDPLPDDPHSDYINANYIDAYRRPDAWIAMQGPSKFTLNDIWRLAWQKNSHRIIMVTNLVEDGRMYVRGSNENWCRRPPEHKCEQYWPDSEGGRKYGDIHVDKVETEQFADFTIRTFTLSKDGEGKTVRQFHFTAWPDHGVPMYATSLLAFRKKIRSYDDPTMGQSIIHCSAGVGRTGTLIALDYLLDQAKVEGQVDVYHCVYTMRTKRVNMVQTQEQFIFVYDALIEALKSGDTSIPCNDFRLAYLDLQKTNPQTGKVKLQEEYELLQLLSPSIDLTGCKDALAPANAEKNRHQNVIPLDNMSRPYLLTYVPGSSDYINAVFTDGYKQRDAFLITQQPMPGTVVDFWAMCFDHECKTVIMMNNEDQHDESCELYYPEDKKTDQYGPFKVETSVCDTLNPEVTVRHLNLVNTKRSTEVRHLRQFQYHGWASDMELPKKMSSLISLLQMVEKWQQHSGNGPIIVHCMDGATRSGVYCAVSYLVERLKLEQEVDVFHSVKHTRINRPQLIPSMTQYKFLYDMAVEYMDCFETYANFK